jgi:tRNA (cmo5U34)-methyltransferase
MGGQAVPDEPKSELSATEKFPSEPAAYRERLRAAIPLYDELEDESIAAIPFAPERTLELGIGTGETARRLLDRYPETEMTGLDASPGMVFRAREMGIEVRLARMEDPLPDGPWDLVISVLSVHHLNPDQKKALFRRVREQSRSLVIGDVVVSDPQLAPPPDPGFDYYEDADELAEWCGGEIVWRGDDLVVIRATYD